MIKTRPHSPKNSALIEFNGEVGIVDRGYRLGGGGFIKIIGRWQNRSANPLLQILFNVYHKVDRSFVRRRAPPINTNGKIDLASLSKVR